jgi:hypothetical protein
MDAYDSCPTCGRLVQGGRVCRYCAQTADPPHREPAAKAATTTEPRYEDQPAHRSPAYGNRALAPIRIWMLIALGLAVLGALVAVVVIWGVP